MTESPKPANMALNSGRRIMNRTASSRLVKRPSKDALEEKNTKPSFGITFASEASKPKPVFQPSRETLGTAFVSENIASTLLYTSRLEVSGTNMPANTTSPVTGSSRVVVDSESRQTAQTTQPPDSHPSTSPTTSPISQTKQALQTPYLNLTTPTAVGGEEVIESEGHSNVIATAVHWATDNTSVQPTTTTLASNLRQTPAATPLPKETEIINTTTMPKTTTASKKTTNATEMSRVDVSKLRVDAEINLKGKEALQPDDALLLQADSPSHSVSVNWGSLNGHMCLTVCKWLTD